MCGGVGAARMLGGLVQVVPPEALTAVVNVGDDTTLHGLHISPDIDTVIYTLAGQINPETGWGLVDESWQARAMLERLGGLTWFQLGDRDLGTHLYRTHRMREGATLAQVTAELAAAWDLRLRVLPATDDRVETRLTTPGEGEIGFQDYFVRLRHDVEVSAVRFVGADAASPAPGVIEAIETAGTVVIAPSNPIVSIGPILAIPGIGEALSRRRETVVAVSPIIAGEALKGPAARLMRELGHDPSVHGVAAAYRDVAGTLVVDEADAAQAPTVEAEGVRCVVASTIMSTAERAALLAEAVLGAADL
jgi:LPPG:FO 2-phospho-L-lactate transferase